MSWETLTVGVLKIKNCSDKDLLLIQDCFEFGNDLEKVNINTKRGITTIDFQSVNWLSHIDEEKINGLIKKLKNKLKFYAITLYRLENEFSQNWYSGKK